MAFQFDFSFFIEELGVAFRFVPVVLLLSFVPLIAGIFFGFLVAVARLFNVRVLSPLLNGLVVFLRGIPIVLLLTVLYLLYNAVSDWFVAAAGLSQEANGGGYLAVALFGLSLTAAVNLSGAIHSSFLSVDHGQLEAGYSVGLTSPSVLLRIVVPQSLPVAIPLIGNCMIGLIKASSVASLISVVEIVSATQMAAVESYKFLEGYFAAALVYWVLCYGTERLTGRLSAVFTLKGEEPRHA